MTSAQVKSEETELVGEGGEDADITIIHDEDSLHNRDKREATDDIRQS